MVKICTETEGEAEAARLALSDGRLSDIFGTRPVSIWLADTYRGGTPGTAAGPEHAPAVGRHRAGAPQVIVMSCDQG